MKIVVTGGTGWVGGEIVRALRAPRRRVHSLSRSRFAPGHLDLEDPNWRRTWPPVLQQTDVVVHAAAHVHRPFETAAERERFHAINSLGVERLLEICSTVGVPRFVLVSTIAVYDWSAGFSSYFEGAPVKPLTAYASSKLSAENAVQKWGGDWRIGRLGTVFGKGDSANFARLAHMLKRRRFFIPGNGEARKSIIHVDRAGELFAGLAVRNDLSRRLMNLAAPTPLSLREVCYAFCAVCNVRRPVSVPVPVMRLGAKVGDLLNRLSIESPITSDVLRKLTQDTVVDVSAMMAAFPEVLWNSFLHDLRKDSAYYANG